MQDVQRRWPFTYDLSKRLLDELEIAFLASNSGRPIGDLNLTYYRSNEIVSCIGTLALADMNFCNNRPHASSLDNAGYSRDPDEAKIQLLIKWRDILGSDNSEMPSTIGILFFDERWHECNDRLLSEAARSVARTGKAIIIEAARKDLHDFSTESAAVIQDLARKLRTGKISHPAPTAEPRDENGLLIGSQEWKLAHWPLFLQPDLVIANIDALELIISKWISNHGHYFTQWQREFSPGLIQPFVFETALRLDRRNLAYTLMIASAYEIEPKLFTRGYVREMYRQQFVGDRQKDWYFVTPIIRILNIELAVREPTLVDYSVALQLSHETLALKAARGFVDTLGIGEMERLKILLRPTLILRRALPDDDTVRHMLEDLVQDARHKLQALKP